MSFANSVEWLMAQVRLTSTHVDYLKSGHCAAAVQFNGEPHLVRELLDRFCELSESERPRPQTADLIRDVQGQR